MQTQIYKRLDDKNAYPYCWRSSQEPS